MQWGTMAIKKTRIATSEGVMKVFIHADVEVHQQLGSAFEITAAIICVNAQKPVVACNRAPSSAV